MGWNDHLDETELELPSLLNELLNSGELDNDPMAKGIVQKVIQEGEASLKGRQVNVFSRFIRPKYIDRECSRCGTVMPYSEVAESWNNGGLCSWCVQVGTDD